MEQDHQISYRIPENTIENYQAYKAKCKDHQVLSKIEQEAVGFYISDFILQNFFIARDFDIERSLEKWLGMVKWREEFKPHKIKFEDVKAEFEKGKAYFYGKDRQGRLVMIIKPRRHWPKEAVLGDFERLLFYLIEAAYKFSYDTGNVKLMVVYDREGVTRKNFDSSLFSVIKGFVPKLQKYYPEMMSKVFILKPNFLYRTMFAILKPFMNKVTVKKITLLSKIEVLKEFIDPKYLLKGHGGVNEDPFEGRGEAVVAEIEKNGIYAYYDKTKLADDVEDTEGKEEENGVTEVNESGNEDGHDQDPGLNLPR